MYDSNDFNFKGVILNFKVGYYVVLSRFSITMF
jgi:hypothetical protein